MSRIAHRIEYVSKVAALFAVASGATALFGWELGFRTLSSFFPGQIAMRPNSAAMYILAGAALWIFQTLQKDGPSHRLLRGIGHAFATAVILSGLVTLSEYLFSFRTGLDHLLYFDPEAPIAGLVPGRMTPIGALNFFLIGCGLFLLGRWKRRGAQLSEFLGFVLILNGMFGLFDFVLHPSSSTTGIAPSSALVTCVLGCGLLTARDDHQFRKLLASQHSGGAVFRRLLPAAVIVPLLLAAVIWAAKDLGFFASDVGLTLLVVMTITAFVWLVMWTTASLDEADQERQSAAAELRVRLRQQAAIAEFGHRALTGIDVSHLMHEAVELVSRTLEVEFCKVQELLPDGKALLLRAAAGWEEGLVDHTRTEARAGSQGGFTLMCEAPVVVEDLRTEDRFIPSPLLASKNVVSGLSVIVSGKDYPFGVLGAHTTRRRQFTQDDVNFLQSVANILTAAIERKQTEKDLRRFNRALRTLSECDLAMARATSEQELLEKVCTLLVEQGGYRMAWAGYAERDEGKTVRPVAIAGAEEGYLAAARITWSDEEHGRGPTGSAIRTGRPQVVRNIMEDPNFAPWREDAVRHGYASTVALPLAVENQPLGV
ncbi:MAG: GAF domain-containing protein, partial [Deltaproteobacteria bacterium]